MSTAQEIHGMADTAHRDPPQDVIELILKFTLDLRTILNVRLTSRRLRKAASKFVKSLVAINSRLPPHLWDVFPHACRLVLRLDGRQTALESPGTPLPALYSTQYDGAPPASTCVLRNTLQLLKQLPQRVESIDGSRIKRYTSPAESVQLAQQLVCAAKCSTTLKELIMPLLCSIEAMEMVLRCLPHLQKACFGPEFITHVPGAPRFLWRTSADLSHMASLKLCGLAMVFDLSGISTGRQLQHVELEAPSFANLASVSSLTSLKSLKLCSPIEHELSAVHAQALAALEQLTRLSLAQQAVPADSWAVLATLPALCDILLGSTTIDAAAPAAAAATSLCVGLLQLEHDAEQLPGCLAHQLPSLQSLNTSTASPAAQQRVIKALRGHDSLRRLQMRAARTAAELMAAAISGDTVAIDGPSVPAWQQQLLSALPALQSLDLVFAAHPGMVLADVSGCSRLTLLSLHNRTTHGLSAAALDALDVGPCSGSLEKVSLAGFSLSVGVALLQRCLLPSLRRLEVLPAAESYGGVTQQDWQAAEQQLIPSAARAAGWQLVRDDSSDTRFTVVRTGV